MAGLTNVLPWAASRTAISSSAGGGVLENVAFGSRFEGPGGKDDIRMHGQEDHLKVAQLLSQLPDGLDAAEKRHGDSDHYKVGAQCLGLLDEFHTVRGGIDYLEFLLQNPFEGEQDDLMIVSQ